MKRQIFINLPVEDLEKSMHFYTQLGFKTYPLFTFDDQKCMTWGKKIFVMLHSKEFFNSENKKLLVNKKKYLIPTFALPVDSLEKVNKIVENCLKAGCIEPTPLRNEGFMQVRTIEDFDGYSWDIIYLNLEAFKKTKNRS